MAKVPPSGGEPKLAGGILPMAGTGTVYGSAYDLTGHGSYNPAGPQTVKNLKGPLVKTSGEFQPPVAPLSCACQVLQNRKRVTKPCPFWTTARAIVFPPVSFELFFTPPLSLTAPSCVPSGIPY